MEPVSAVASIIGIVGAGAKLSIVLFDLANLLGSAGTEIRAVATEITLFCSVLRQLEKTLGKAKRKRYSISAIETTQQILHQCRDVFHDIEAVIKGLQPRNGSPGVTLDVKTRFKWTFVKRSKLHLHRTTLESCKITLLLMITTLDFAHRISSRRESTSETEVEDEQEELMTQSLVIAQQVIVGKLGELEDEDEVNTEELQSDEPTGFFGDKLVDYSLAPSSSLPLPKPTENTIEDMAEGGANRTSSTRSKRRSAWLQGVVSERAPEYESRRNSQAGSLSHSFQLPDLLWKWTDQGEHWEALHMKTSDVVRDPSTLQLHSAEPRAEVMQHESIADLELSSPSVPPSSQQATVSEVSSLHIRTFNGNASKSKAPRKIPSPLALGTESQKLSPSPISPAPLTSPLTATFKSKATAFEKTSVKSQDTQDETAAPHSPYEPRSYSRRINRHDTYDDIVEATMQQLKLPGNPADYKLCMAYTGGDFVIERSQRPFALFKDLQRSGRKPSFTIQELNPLEGKLANTIE